MNTRERVCRAIEEWHESLEECDGSYGTTGATITDVDLERLCAAVLLIIEAPEGPPS